MDERIKQIADLYGFRHQCLKCVEEMAELAAEITRYTLGGVPDGKENIPYPLEEELADVIIMTQQLMYLANTGYVEEEIERKLNRQMERIDKARATIPPIDVLLGDWREKEEADKSVK